MGRLFRGQLARYEPKVQEFVSYLGGISGSDVDFSWDGRWVAYVSSVDRTLRRSKVDGTERLQLTFPPMTPMLPRWSPDGKRIAFMRQPPGEAWKIHLVSAQGGSPQQVISGSQAEEDPQWSPDGNQLLFAHVPASASDAYSLCLLDMETHRVSTVPSSEGLRSPRWSRDGRRVVTLKDENRKLVLFDLPNHQQVELAATKGDFGWPNWSRDGKWIYLLADFTEGKKGIYRVRVSDGKMELVVSDEVVGRSFGTSGPWVGLAPDDSAMVMRDVSLTDSTRSIGKRLKNSDE